MEKYEAIDWTYEVTPELYDTKPRIYYIRRPEYGTYSKKEAEVICAFMRKNFKRIVLDYLSTPK